MRFEDFVVKILAGNKWGTGFFLKKDRIVTCWHVVDGAPKISFSFAGDSTNKYPAQVWKALPKHDLAVLSIERLEKITPLTIASISGKGKMKAESLGYSFGGKQTVFATLEYSNVSLKDDGTRLLQFDVANNVAEGFSGAPVLAEEKYLIGVISKFVGKNPAGRGVNIACAIPADVLKELFPEQYDDTYRYYLDEPRFRELVRENDDTGGLSHFRFAGGSTQFHWSNGVREAFDAFHRSKETFSWWLIVGGAGTGKSRTALEFCDSLKKEGWMAGFLDPEGRPFNFWETWEPARDTFLVVDYVGQKQLEANQRGNDGVAGIILCLAKRVEQNDLHGKKIRILLLEREYKERRGTENEFVWYEAMNRGLGKQYRYEKTPFELPVPGNQELYEIAKDALRSLNATACLPEYGIFIGKLTEIDKKKRPLFAMLLASYLGEAGRKSGQVKQSEVLDHAIREEFRRVLKRAEVDEKNESNLKALVISTLTGGKAGDFKLESSEHPLWNSGLGYASDGNDHQFRFYPLEPDLVGEHFILKGCGCPENSYIPRIADTDMQEWIGEAWQTHMFEVGQFFTRCAQDFSYSPEWVERRFLPIAKKLRAEDEIAAR
ncbi:MAG: serine protease [Candidatus Accumulibacter sp.]|jgi:hypothetical protein|nr:serine protease [Accumulibacter sp.]